MGRRRTTSFAAALVASMVGIAAAAESSDQPARAPEGSRATQLEERIESMPPERRDRVREMRRRYQEATPQQRREFRRRTFVRRLARSQRASDAGWHRMSPDERQQLREQILALPPGEAHALRGKLRRYNSLPEAERAELQERFEVLRSLDSNDREQIEVNAERWKTMSPDRRARVRAAWQRFNALPPEEQDEVLDSLLDDEPR